jgi:hypothetical protein
MKKPSLIVGMEKNFSSSPNTRRMTNTTILVEIDLSKTLLLLCYAAPSFLVEETVSETAK